MYTKTYVDVLVGFDIDGNMKLKQILWENGRKYIVDKVLYVRPAALLKVGGQGDLFTIIVWGKQSYLWFEWSAALSGCQFGRWFV